MLRTADIFFLVRFIPEMQLAHRYEVIYTSVAPD